MTHPVDLYVGRRLRLRRTALGLSQEDIALALDLTFQQVQKNEKGLNRMGASRLYDLSKILACDIGYFFDGFDAPGIPPQREPDQRQFYARESLELMRHYYRIKDGKVRRKLFEMVKTLGRTEEEDKA